MNPGTRDRVLAWLRRHLALAATLVTFSLVVAMLVGSFKVYDDRREEIAVIKELTRRTAVNAAANRQRAMEQCEGINGTNSTIRFILDAGLRLRSPDNPISPALRQAYIDAYKRLPLTDCETGAKTVFDPPFPPSS